MPACFPDFTLPCVLGCYALYPGGRKCYLLSTLASNPAVRTEWFWASTFGFAVSSSYLNAEEFVNIKAVVTRCLQQFAGYLAGVGIPGEEYLIGRPALQGQTLHIHCPASGYAYSLLLTVASPACSLTTLPP